MNAFARFVSLRLGLIVVLAVIASMARPVAVRAADQASSLDIVPDDAAFYSSMLRNREQFNTIANSKAWAKVAALPGWQMAMGLYQMQAADPNSPAGYLQAALSNPESRKSIDFLADIFSDEVFVYGGSSFNKFIELYQNVYGTAQMAGFKSAFDAAQKGKGPPSNDEAQARALVQALMAHVDEIQLPDLIIGLKVKDKDFAKQLLEKLETNVQPIFAGNPALNGRFKRESVGAYSYLTLTLEGGMVPWDPQVEEKIRSYATTPADADKLIDHLKKTKLVISLGLRDDFLIIGFGPSTEALAKLGTSPLRAREELAAVKKHSDKRITAVTYSSKAFNQHFGASKADIDNFAKVAKDMLPGLPLPDKLKEDLGKTADDLSNDLKSVVTEIGASASVGFLTNRGSESFSYDWSEHPEIDCSKPLDILKHVGGNPVVVIAGRGKYRPEDYETLVKWVKTAYRYAEEYAVPQIPPKERPEFDKFMVGVQPLVARLDKTLRESFMPALADGQSALVIDAKFTSRQYLKNLPPTEEAMPMIEPAIVLGVSDAGKLKKAMHEFYAIADDAVELAKSLDDKHEIPATFTIPRPKEFNLKSGKLWGYALPAEAGVDTRIMPNAGLSDNVAVLSMSGRHTQRLLGETDPIVAGIKLPTNRPYGTVAAFDFTMLLDAAAPWVDLGMAQGMQGATPENADMIKQHVKTTMEVLHCYHGTVAVTYQEGKITVTRSRSEFKDLDQ